jgi:hypothetical protein
MTHPNLTTDVFEYHHPDLNAPMDVTIAFDSVWRYANGRDYETLSPYIEAVYVRNIDIMPVLSDCLLKEILNEYKDQEDDPY